MLEEAVSSATVAIFGGSDIRHELQPTERKRPRRMTEHEFKVLQLWSDLTPSQRDISLAVTKLLSDDTFAIGSSAEDHAAKAIASVYLDGCRALGSTFYVVHDETGKESVCEEYPEGGWSDEDNARLLDLCRVYRSSPEAKRMVREQLISEGHVHLVGAHAGAVQ